MQDIETLTYTEALALREELATSQEYNARLLEIITRLKKEVKIKTCAHCARVLIFFTNVV